jgi:hypothetical protein
MWTTYVLITKSNQILTFSFSIAVAAPFSGLWRFPEGRGFKQWTGDDSKALMKVRQILYISLTLLIQYMPDP